MSYAKTRGGIFVPVGLSRRRAFAKYDAAQTTNENTRHWANADALSADAAASVSVRQTIRNRARYEVANNSYARGIVSTLANDTIGTGPRLQLLTNDKEYNRQAEQSFEDWAQETGLAEILRTMICAKIQDGESFLILGGNPKARHNVQLGVSIIEADRVTSNATYLRNGTIDNTDGIDYDDYGNPTLYRVLKNHPGSTGVSGFGDAVMVPSDYIIHLYRRDRPEQHRGVSELAPALPLFAMLRRYTLAVLTSAESQSEITGFLHTDSAANGAAAAEVPEFEPLEFYRNQFWTLPEGWRSDLAKPNQPVDSYPDFKREVLNEIARCLNMPYNVAACNSSDYNYASGRLDHQTYFRSIDVERSLVERVVLRAILRHWFNEYILSTDIGQRNSDTIPKHMWFWPGREHVDPLKEASAQAKRLESGTTTLAVEYARQGIDYAEAIRERAEEEWLIMEAKIENERRAKKLREQYGLGGYDEQFENSHEGIRER